jgi:chromosome segregation ATPase
VTTEIQNARAVSDDLLAKIAAVKLAIVEIDTRRAGISLAALGDGDTEAQKKLAQVHKERATRVLELEDLEAALAASKRRIVEVQSAASAEVDRQRAEKAEPIAKRLAERGAKLDAAIRDYCEHYGAIQADIDELARLGCPIPSRDLVRVNLRRSHDASVMFVDKHARPVAPLERIQFSKLTQGWAVPALEWIKSRLSNAAKAA